jgi:hypothetical protein
MNLLRFGNRMCAVLAIVLCVPWPVLQAPTLSQSKLLLQQAAVSGHPSVTATRRQRLPQPE